MRGGGPWPGAVVNGITIGWLSLVSGDPSRARPETPDCAVCERDPPVGDFNVYLFSGIEEWLSTLRSHHSHLKCLLKLQMTGPPVSLDPSCE